MCWITLNPTKRRHHDHHHHSDHGPYAEEEVEELVRLRHNVSNSRFSKVRVIAPNLSIHPEPHHHHHLFPHSHHGHHLHLHPHIHPLHMHPTHHHHRNIKLHGPGKKRCPIVPPAPPPSRSPSSYPPHRGNPRSRSRSKEPLYRTQIVEPRTQEVRETTRIALREVRPERGRLRRVAGYEMLGREVPWNWDCISSVADGSTTRVMERKKRSANSGLKFPPFGSMERWME